MQLFFLLTKKAITKVAGRSGLGIVVKIHCSNLICLLVFHHQQTQSLFIVTKTALKQRHLPRKLGGSTTNQELGWFKPQNYPPCRIPRNIQKLQFCYFRLATGKNWHPIFTQRSSEQIGVHFHCYFKWAFCFLAIVCLVFCLSTKVLREAKSAVGSSEFGSPESAAIA